MMARTALQQRRGEEEGTTEDPYGKKEDPYDNNVEEEETGQLRLVCWLLCWCLAWFIRAVRGNLRALIKAPEARGIRKSSNAPPSMPQA